MSVDISIVIPTYNRNGGLKKCLSSLFDLDYPNDRFEIIVVDDSVDGGAKKVFDELKINHSHLRYFTQGHKGPAAARNLGTKASVGEIIGFIDDDCAVCSNWAKLMVEIHRKNPQIITVGGLTLTSSQRTAVLASQFLSIIRQTSIIKVS